MTNASPGPLIELELHPALAAVARSAGTRKLTRDVAATVTAVMAGFGIPGRARAAARRKTGSRAACVFVDGRISPYPPSFLRRLWFTIAPSSLRPLAFDGSVPERYPDAWLIACAERPSQEAREVIEELVRRLAGEVVALRPSSLLTAEAVGARDDRDLLMLIGRALVDRSVRLPDVDGLRELLAEHRSAGRSPADTLEDIYAGLRARALELHLHPDVFTRLSGGSETVDRIAADDPQIDAEMAAAMTVIRDYHLVELGLRLPVVLVRSERTEPDEIRVKMNDRLGPPIPIPRPGEYGVSAPLSRLSSEGIEARPLVDAVTGHELAAVRAEDADAAARVGLLPARQGPYIAAALGRAASPLAHRLLSIEEVEEDLAVLEEHFPSLVHGVLSRFSLTTVTQVLRELVREQVSIRDPWAVLNAMLCYAELVSISSEELPAEDIGEGSSDSGPRVDSRLFAFVRREIGDRVAYDSGALEQVGNVNMRVFVTDADFEAQLARLAAGSDGDAELNTIRDDVWCALGDSPQPEPVFVTAGRVRHAMRDALAFELPGARVLARSELPPEVTLECLGVVTPSH